MDKSTIILPPAIKQGDCIGLFSPAGPVVDQERFEAGLRLLHELGFSTRQYTTAPCTSQQYLAAEDSARAEEFHNMWTDPEVHAMMAVRGGYGCLRMMPFLDLDRLRENPKLVIGFSDLTVLLNTLADRTGIVALHGPVLTSLDSSDPDSVTSFIGQLTGDIKADKIFHGLEILRNGSATGTIRGGNLTTIAHLLGTPWEIPFKNTLLLLEDTGEPLYKIDRILTQLFVSGRLEQLSGLILGTFDCGTYEDVNLKLQEDVWKRVLELTSLMNFPVWGNFPAGHLKRNQTVPLGVTATMNSSTDSITVHADIFDNHEQYIAMD